ncbi:hypothetical protein B296_00029552 [Ensete ventricosum]|uniref:Uncharacterized protein n=1 Tax=Ensete ventricosum TaxID=4639 RepID=A0A426YWA7_ENSVE|nr:hypothetical protein B296_00029552 [Ensete ventricosum]
MMMRPMAASVRQLQWGANRIVGARNMCALPQKSPPSSSEELMRLEKQCSASNSILMFYRMCIRRLGCFTQQM